MMSEFDFLCTMINREKNKEEKETKRKIDLKITFIDGGEIVIPDDLWDDYRYDGKFFTVVKDGIDIAMYNAIKVFSLVLVKHQEKAN
jgi:hypothetical protein